MTEAPTLNQAVRKATSRCQPEPPEEIALGLGYGRVTTGRVAAARPAPPFAQAARDGYALRRRDRHRVLDIVGEVAAGSRQFPACGPGQALRIMTGAPVPAWCDLVVPQEEAREELGKVTVTGAGGAAHIRPRGCDLARGQTIAKKGTLLKPEHLALAAATGVNRVLVHRIPQVMVLCTGSELIAPGGELESGQIFSANLLLLQGLIRENGGAATVLETAPDRPELIVNRLRTMLAARPRLLITTGGTGPGRYDLMARVFSELQLETIFTGLAVKPGHHTRMGQLGETLLCALPGPPPAVRLLFNELVRPLLRKLTGRQGGGACRARLSAPLSCKGRRITNLKGGVYALTGGVVTVREAGRDEPSNCVMVLPARTRDLAVGSPVTIHLAR